MAEIRRARRQEGLRLLSSSLELSDAKLSAAVVAGSDFANSSSS